MRTHDPDKTFIGQIERGFDFLGYHFGPQGLALVQRTIEQFVERASRLYEQELGDASRAPRFGVYVRRWAGWATGDLSAKTRHPMPPSPGTQLAMR